MAAWCPGRARDLRGGSIASREYMSRGEADRGPGRHRNRPRSALPPGQPASSRPVRAQPVGVQTSSTRRCVSTPADRAGPPRKFAGRRRRLACAGRVSRPAPRMTYWPTRASLLHDRSSRNERVTPWRTEAAGASGSCPDGRQRRPGRPVAGDLVVQHMRRGSTWTCMARHRATRTAVLSGPRLACHAWCSVSFSFRESAHQGTCRRPVENDRLRGPSAGRERLHVLRRPYRVEGRRIGDFRTGCVSRSVVLLVDEHIRPPADAPSVRNVVRLEAF